MANIRRHHENYIILTICGAAAGSLLALAPGYAVFAVLVFALLWLIKKFARDDYQFLLYAILASVVLRFVCVILLDFFLARTGSFVKIYGYQTPDIFGDSGYYSLRSWWMAQHWMGLPLSEDIIREIGLKEYGRHGYLYFLTSLYYLFGFDTVLSKLFTSFFGVLLSVNIFFIAKHVSNNVLTRRLAFILTSLWPTLFLWSLTSLKDIPIVFFSSLLMLMTLKFLGMKLSNGKGYLLPVFIFFIIVIAVFMRRSLNMLFILPFFMALFIRFRVVRWLSISCFVIFVIGMYINPDLMNTVNARINEKVIVFHKGSILTGGNTVKIFPDKYYVFVSGIYGGYRYYVPSIELVKGGLRGALLPFIQPLPHRMGLDVNKRIILSALMGAWYIALIFAVLGCAKLLIRGHRRIEIIILVLSILSVSAAIMLTTGNVGAIIRWRSLIEPFVFVFTAEFLAENYPRFSKSAVASLLRIGRR